jgi:beta-galactosidase
MRPTISTSLVTVVLVLSLSVSAFAAPDRYKTFLFGVAYYPELCPESLWERDADLMKEAGVNVVRIGEFAWSLMEPEEGKFDFSLFDRAIAVLAKRGIKVVFGTPTATPPKWLTAKYPEVLHVFPDGHVADDQSRRYYCYNSPVYRRLSKRIVEEIARHYAKSPEIVGWQIDNEMNNENRECYSDSCRTAFRAWLRAKYTSLDTLNQRWGTRFWSQWYTAWDQIDLPFATPSLHHPSLMLDFRRFISDSAGSYKSDQVEILRRYRPDDFITHNGLFKYIDYYDFARDLDIHSYSNYPTFMDEPRYPTGAAMTHLRGVNGRMMIMEQLTGPAGQTYLLRTPRPGEMNLWAFQTIAHGAEGVVHFNWRTARGGVETYWYGVLDADSVPRARYREFQKEGKEIARIGAEVLGSRVLSDVAVIRDYDAEWAFDHQFLVPEASYGTAFNALFRAASDARYNVDIVSTEADLSRYKVVFAPALVLMDAELAGRLTRFVEGGGTLVMSAHSAVRDRDNTLTDKALPVDLTGLFGVEVEWFQTYKAPSRDGNAVSFADGASAPIRVFAEVLAPKSAEVVGRWASDTFAGSPACTERRAGKGLAVYYGSFFDLDSARVLLKRYATRAGIEPILAGVPQEVEVTRRTKGTTHYYFLLNHSASKVEVAPGEGFVDAIAGAPAPAKLTLGPFEYRVLRK